MPADYLPTTDAGFDAWQLNYCQRIIASSGTYGLDQSYADALGFLSADFHEKLRLAGEPATRTKLSVSAKDAARAELKRFIRIGVGITQRTVAVTNAAREALGIPIHSTSPRPID